MNLTEQDVRRIADEAAKKAIHDMLITMGADPEDPIELQKDFAHLRSWRESSETVKRHALLTAIGVIVVGFLGILAVAFRGGP